MSERLVNRLDGARVLVLGLGASGLAMAAWCARQGAHVTAWDTRLGSAAGEALAHALHERVPSAAIADDASDGFDRIFKSPGLAPSDARLAPIFHAATARGLQVEGELDLYAEALAALRADRGYAPRVLAVTGTNGKTTTTVMTALLVERAGKTVAVAGNIGPTLLDTLAAALDKEQTPLPEAWVLELSSFQLHDAHGFEPDAAALLNLTQDHLDWHGTLDAYGAAKARIFGARTVRVVNRDDAAVERLATLPAARPARGSRAKPAPKVVRFGLDAPRQPGDFGLVVERGMAWLARAPEAEPKTRREAAEALPLQRLMPADALRVRGRHNAANALAALALASAIGCPLAPMLHGLRDYRGEPHRVAYVATIGGVDWFDDSKGTNVGATVAALDGLGADRAPGKLLLILGGDGKGQDFAPLAAPMARHARAAALIGRDAGAIADALANVPVPLERCADLPAAVRWAADQAHAGDAVLLSPACASLDMFRDYAHRADVFVAEVEALAAEQGVVA